MSQLFDFVGGRNGQLAQPFLYRRHGAGQLNHPHLQLLELDGGMTSATVLRRCAADGLVASRRRLVIAMVRFVRFAIVDSLSLNLFYNLKPALTL